LPTRLWLPGDVVVDEYVVPIASGAVGPAAAVIRVGVYGGPDREPLPALDARLRPIEGGAAIARVRLAPGHPLRGEPEHLVEANLGNRVVLVGYDLSPAAPEAGGNLVIDLYWKPLARLTHDYTVFVHLCDDAGTPLAQSDGQPIDGALPTSLWLPKIVVRDERTIDLPAALPPGAYHLRVGLYRLETMERLEVIAPQHAVADRAVELTTVTVR